MRRWIVLAALAVGLLTLFPVASMANEADSILGEYWSEKRDGRIEIFRQGEEYLGRIVWGKRPGKDTKNPDPTLRDRDIIGLVFLEGFTYDGAGTWVDGKVYSPRHGQVFDAKMWLEEGGAILKMRGFVGISLFGATASFTRDNQIAANES